MLKCKKCFVTAFETDSPHDYVLALSDATTLMMRGKGCRVLYSVTAAISVLQDSVAANSGQVVELTAAHWRLK